MRVLRGSHTHGLAGMTAIREMHGLRLLRPLLGVAPDSLRQFLTEAGVAWVEDPSNHDYRALRPRLRRMLADHVSPDAAAALQQAISQIGRLRAREEADIAAELSARATLRPEGFALLSAGRIGEAALSRLFQIIAGSSYPPPLVQIADLAADPRPATAAGVRLLHAGRLGDGLLVLREEAAIPAPVAAAPDMVWDDRFRLIIPRGSIADATIGALGPDAAHFRGLSDLPSVVLRTLPAVRFGKVVASVPHLAYAVTEGDAEITVMFMPGTTFPVFVPANR
jgi:tRNA(Ile)-lysidine synthase